MYIILFLNTFFIIEPVLLPLLKLKDAFQI